MLAACVNQFIMRPSYRPHYASCPSVCPSVCPVRARNSKTKKRRKIKIDRNVPQGTSKWSTSFQLKRSKVKVTWRQKPQKMPYVWRTFTYGRCKCRRLKAPTANLAITSVRPNLLSTPETLGNWTDGRISCRHSATTSFLVNTTNYTFN